jgi:hypothetical protein
MPEGLVIGAAPGSTKKPKGPPMTATSLLRRTALAAAICATAVGAGIAAPSSAQAAAAPYITTPGVHAYYAGNVAVFTAHIQCSDWKGIAALKVGTQGVRVLTRALYICENGGSTNVRFTVSGDQLPVDGKYQYTILVGRHDADGNVTRWTHSLSGFFTKY